MPKVDRRAGRTPQGATRPIKVSFIAKAGEQPPQRNLNKMTRPVRIGFTVRVKGSQKRKRISFIARR